jgi:nitronate monooxygenase/enoyl-[acyl-carrier protein] reductase II
LFRLVSTRFCDLLGVELPVVLAPFGPWEQVDLAAAVCNAGGLGSVGTAVRSPDELRSQWARLRHLTDRPFAINHTGRPFDDKVFSAILQERPAAISFHMGVPADRIVEAHAAGVRWIQQVGDVRSAEVALEAVQTCSSRGAGRPAATPGGSRRWSSCRR